MSQNIFEKLLAGGIIRNDEMGEAWEVVFRAQRLSPALNASTTIEEMRQRLSELIQSDIDKTTTVFVPFHTNFGKHIKIGKNVFINHACSFLDLGGITIEDDVLIGPRVNLTTENHPVDPAKRKFLEFLFLRQFVSQMCCQV
jgi:acetyltransferase-like isoleucine patch superfamily enzyme